MVEGHGSGLTDPHDISAFVAAGLSSDHEVWALDEAWDRLQRGLFVELRPFSYDAIIPGLIERGLDDWSNVAFTTDDRSASRDARTRRRRPQCAPRHPLRASQPEIAIQCATINPARHMRIEQWVGTIAPGRYADIVLLDDVERVSIAEVYADGIGRRKARPMSGPKISVDWPDWANQHHQCRPHARPPPTLPSRPRRAGRRCTPPILRPFHWNEDFLVEDLPVADGLVQRDTSRQDHQMVAGRSLSRRRRRGLDVLDRLRSRRPGHGARLLGRARQPQHLGRRLVRCGHGAWPSTTWANMQGGWALVHRGKLVADVRLEIAGILQR